MTSQPKEALKRARKTAASAANNPRMTKDVPQKNRLAQGMAACAVCCARLALARGGL